jgi:hypothetical protein
VAVSLNALMSKAIPFVYRGLRATRGLRS